MKNGLQDLNNYLFEELERLNDDETLTGDNLDKEIARSNAITKVSCQIVANAKVMLEAKVHCDNFGYEENTFYKLEEKKNNTNQYEEFGKLKFKEEMTKRLNA